MGFTKIPCPGLYVEWKNKNPEKFVEMIKAFVEHNDRGMKAIGVETSQDGQVYILKMPDYDVKKPVVSFKTVKGKKTKQVEYVQMWTVPIESFLSDDDFEYLKKRGMDRYGNKIK